MKGRKGVAVTTIAIVLAVFGSLVASVFALGSIQSFLTFILDNFYMLIIVAAGFAGVIIWVRNSDQKNPQWRKDLIGGGLIILVVLILFLVVPSAAGLLYGSTATITVHTFNPVFSNDLEITGVDVSVERSGPIGSIAGPNIQTGSLAGTVDDYSGTIDIRCGGEDHVKTFSGSVIEETTDSRTIKIRNLKGNSCVGQVHIENSGQRTDTASLNFNLPSSGS